MNRTTSAKQTLESLQKNNTISADDIVGDTNKYVPSSFSDNVSINQSKNQFELDCIDRHEDGKDWLFFSY